MKGPPRRRRGNPEADIQRVIVKDLRLLLSPPPQCILHHSANESGKASRTAQAILVGMGVFPGFSDLIALGPNRAACFLEVKSKAGRQTSAQKEFEEAVEAMGWVYAVVRSTDDCIEPLRRAGIPLRIRGR